MGACLFAVEAVCMGWGVVVSVSSSTYKVMEESRRRRLGQCWWIWNQA